MNRSLHSSRKHDWETPDWLFRELDARFRFTLDAAASAENAKCARFFTEKDNALVQRWRGRVWLNSPYGRELPLWIAKARNEANDGATVVCLVPARTDTRWWHNSVARARGVRIASWFDDASCTLTIVGSHGATEVRFLPGRLRFKGAAAGAPFPSAVVAFLPPGRLP